MSTSGNNKGILLDLDNTLYAYAPCNAAGNAAAFALLAKKLKNSKRKVAKTVEAARAAVKKEIPETAASHSRLLYFQSAIETLTGRSEPKLALAAEKIFWQAYFRKMKLRPGVKQFLAETKKHGTKIAIVSDFTAEIQMKKLVRLGIDRYIDALITSEESGRDKPARNSFRLALKKLKLRASDVIMIGDDEARDKVGAEKMGIGFFKTTNFAHAVKIVARRQAL